MPRALAVRHLAVDAHGRAAYLARVAERVASARACGHQLRAYEQDGTPGRFMELVEAADRGALRTALLQDELLAESLDFRQPAPDAAEWQLLVALDGAD